MQKLNTAVNYNEKSINGCAVHLTRKVKVPSNTVLQCVEWNLNTNFIASGGSGGLLKVLKLAPVEIGSFKDSKGGAPMNMSVNQALEGHSGTVLCAAWNELQQKLTTSDSNGLIIVWSLHNESWYEEMINNRNKSMVVGMAWNNDGSKIAIAYQDGQVIVGTMDGNRIWNKELPGNIAACEWSPDGSILLFGMADGEVHSYDSQGTFLQKLHMVALESVELETALANDPTSEDLRKDNIIALKWFAVAPRSRVYDSLDRGSPMPFRHGQNVSSPMPPRLNRLQSVDPLPHPSEPRIDNRPRLLIAYAHGVVQLMRNDNDTSAIVTRFPQLTITSARWSPNGSFFAVTGQQMDMPQQERSVLHIVTAYGVKLTSLKVMCDSLNGCAWDPTGVKLALCAENQLYFANVRPRYKWGYCGQTVIYSYEKPDRSDYRVVFYETKLDEAFSKPIRNLEQVASYDDYCIIVNKQDDTMGTYLIQLCNGIGTCVDFKYVDVEPRCIGLNGTWAVIAGVESYFIWRFVVPKRNAMNLGRSADIKEDTVHVLDSTTMGNELGMRRKRGTDPIMQISMGDTFCFLYCESGALYKVALMDGSILHKYNIPQNIVQIQLNSSKQRLATLDMSNQLQLFDLNETSLSKVPGLDIKEVVDFCWDKEKDDSIAYISKQKLIVLRGREAEEGVPCEGYICSFCGLTVRTVLLDNFLLPNMKADRKFVIDIEIKSFREAKVLLERLKIQEASEFIEKNPHPRLWSLLAEVALNKLDIPTAEHAYVMLQDYNGLQFCKRLQRILNNDVKKAEVAAHLGKLEEAERIYIDTDRRELAIEMYRKVGDWIRILRILNAGGAGNASEDTLRMEAYSKVGDYYADRQKWKDAAEHYELARDLDKLMNCYLMMDDFYGLDTLSKQLPDSHPLLVSIGEIFGSSGLCEAAVDCFLRCDKVGEALDVCIQLNQWDKAVSLSRTHNLKDVDDLLGKYAAELTGSNERSLAAVQLYRRAGRFLDAARIVFEIAEEERKKAAPCLRLKKIYVLGALLIEEYHEYNRTNFAKGKGKNETDAGVALNGLLDEDVTVSLEDSRMIDKAWKGAQAYHFFMLAQKQLFDGNHDGAMKTSLYLTEFEDILDPVEVFSLLALASCASRQFSLSSRAFMKLETLPDMPADEKKAYQKLALDIFSRYPPTDTRPQHVHCTGCDKLIRDYALFCSDCDTKFPICIVTGRPMMDYQFWLCPVCKHKAYEQHIHNHKFCPLCHAQIV